MGTVCPCFKKQDEEEQPLQPGSARLQKNYTTGSTTPASDDSTTVRRLIIKQIPVPDVNQRIQDEVEQFHAQLDRLDRLRNLMTELRTMYPYHNQRRCVADVFYYLKKYRNSGLEVVRSVQYCVQIKYTAESVDSEAHPAFDRFNAANALVKDIMDQGKHLRSSIQAFLQEDQTFRSAILAAKLDTEGPDALKAYFSNVKELERVFTTDKLIRQEAIGVFEELKTGARFLFET